MQRNLLEQASGDSTPARSLTSAVLQALRTDLIEGHIEPGTKLSIVLISKEYGVSPGLVREALSRLSSEGLVEAIDQRGFRASPVSPEALMDITRVRILVESEAIRRAIALGDTNWEAGILAAFHKLSRTAYYPDTGDPSETNWGQRHKEFHRSLIAACDSEWLLRFHDLLFDQTERYRRLNRRYQTEVPVDERRDVHEQHRRLMEAVLNRGEEEAVTLIAEHFLGTAERVARNAETGAAPPPARNGKRSAQGAEAARK